MCTKRGRPAGEKQSAGSKKAANKSKLPPKYRDPVSGATWSGHARPPAWIKDAPDRSVYLIDGASRRNGAATKNTSKRNGRSVAKKFSRASAQSAAA
nr:H-NS histone family protein [Caballeronia temeraria]